MKAKDDNTIHWIRSSQGAWLHTENEYFEIVDRSGPAVISGIDERLFISEHTQIGQGKTVECF